MGAHSIISPSSAHVWTRCTGSPRLRALRGIDRSSEAAEEGTLAHEVFAALLRGAAPPPCPDEMLEDCLNAAMAVHTQGAPLHIEEPVPLTVIAPECFGTPDVWAFDKGDILRVWDLKYGWGAVEAQNNLQLIAYAAGILESLGRLEGDSVTLSLSILQPRPYHAKGPWRTWVLTAPELRQHLHTLKRQAEVALRGNPSYSTGSHCGSCSARHACPAFQESAGLAIDMSASPNLPPAAPAPEMARELGAIDAALEVLKFRREALAGCVEDELRAGRSVPGWEMKREVGRLKWTIETEQVLALGAVCGLDLSKPGTVTPTQAKKAGVPAEVLGQMTGRGESVKLSRVSLDNLKEIFKDGKESR